MKYLQEEIGLPLILSIDNKSSNIKWCIDAVFVIHADTRSYTGEFVNMGRGIAFFKSSIKNSTQRI